MSLSISLSSELERLLRARAQAQGVAPDAYAARIVEASLRGPADWLDILAPIQEALRSSGLKPQEIEQSLRDEFLASRREGKQSP